MNEQDLAPYFRTHVDDRRTRRGTQVAATLLQSLATEPDEQRRLQIFSQLDEVLTSVANSAQPPIRAHYDFFAVPFAFFSRLQSGIAHGEAPAENLLPAAPGKALDDIDPVPSTFWRRPDSIPQQDLYHGFGRVGPNWPQGALWEYAGPKLNYGVNPGFEARSGPVKIRVKFGEQRSEAFAARIFWALGYNVDPTDYCEGLKLRYNRRFFREFNLRKEIQTQFRFLGLPLYTMKLQKRRDPFSFIAAAVMTDGRQISGSQLRQELLTDPGKPPEGPVDSFREEVEERVEYLLTVPANVQTRNSALHSIGPWKFGDLRHEAHRELRGAGLLAAWIGWYDSRFHNTRLKVASEDGAPRLYHSFSDLGGGLGRGKGLFSGKSERPNEFLWEFTEPAKVQGKGRMTIPFRITGYRPMEKNPAFEQMTLDDARWMARLIGQLSERQIVECLIGSGFDSAEARLYTEKLISRRDRMVCDLGLAAEIPPLRPFGVNKRLNYDPREQRPVSVRCPISLARNLRNSHAPVVPGWGSEREGERQHFGRQARGIAPKSNVCGNVRN